MQDPQPITAQPSATGAGAGVTTQPDGNGDGAAPLAPRPNAGGAPPSPQGYRTAPDQQTTAWPPGVTYIVGNEACERFSFYGMRAILFTHLAALYVAAGLGAAAAEERAVATTHLFFAAVYALPMIGALLADRLLGKYRTILYLSLLYCVGNATQAFAPESLPAMYLGLALIAVGSGGIKPCVSANVGDQFGQGNWHRMRTVYQIFYFSINFGSFFATLLIPATRNRFGPAVAFGLPGVLMFLSTVIFWLGRRSFVHVPPNPGGRLGLLDVLSSVCLFMTLGHFFFTPKLLTEAEPWLRLAASLALSAGFLALALVFFFRRQRLRPDDGFLAVTLFSVRHWLGGRGPRPPEGGAGHRLARSRFWGPAVARFGAEATEGPVAVFKIVSVFFLVSAFWALFDQKATTWTLQAQQMDRTLWEGVQLDARQVMAANPFLVMVLIPLLSLAYRRWERAGLAAPPLARMTVGMLITSLSFVATALIQARIDEAGPGQVWVVWQLIPYVILTLGEVMVSVTGLEFAYSQAPKRMKSTVMGFWALTVTVGNVLVALLAGVAGLTLVSRFWVFAGLMLAAGLLFGLRAWFYVPRDYTQG